MNREHHKLFIKNFAATLKGRQLYPSHHPATERLVQTLLESYFTLSHPDKPIKMGLLEGTLLIGPHLFTEATPGAGEISRQLQTLQLTALEFHSGINIQELEAFLDILDKSALKGEQLKAYLEKEGIQHIQVVPSDSEEKPDEKGAARKVYRRALKAVSHIFHDVRLGKIPSSSEVMTAVKGMVQVTLAQPHALFAMSLLKDYDNYTFTHSVNVSVIALSLGRACDIGEKQLYVLGLGALLHDLGKLKIDREIINKPGRLTDQEFEQIKKHPRSGADIVEKMGGMTKEVADIVLEHHLHYDRKGYPAELQDRKISFLAEIVAIADSYDAITTLRSYQRPLTPRQAIKRLQDFSGTALNPHFLQQFIASLGTYPVGSLVRLNTNEIGVVVGVKQQNPDDVILKILFDKDGEKLSQPLEIDLSAQKAQRIVGEVDPFLRGIDVTDYFD